MSTTLNIQGHDFKMPFREALKGEGIQAALRCRRVAAYKAPVYCLCCPGLRLPLIPFVRGGIVSLRRKRISDPHGDDCPNMVDAWDVEMDARVFRIPDRLPSARFNAFASRFVNTLNAAAWENASLRCGQPSFPDRQDFMMGALVANRDLGFPRGQFANEVAASAGLTLKVGVCGGVSADPREGGMVDLWVATLPLMRGLSLKWELWSVRADFLGNKLRSITERSSFIVVAAENAALGIPDFSLFRMFRASDVNGCFAPVASWAEAAMMRHLFAMRRPGFVATDLASIRRKRESLGLSYAVATGLDYRPDIICPEASGVTTFIEVTSFDGGELADLHRDRVIGRIRHFLHRGEGAVRVEVWQLSGSVPQHVHTVSTVNDMRALEAAWTVSV